MSQSSICWEACCNPTVYIKGLSKSSLLLIIWMGEEAQRSSCSPLQPFLGGWKQGSTEHNSKLFPPLRLNGEPLLKNLKPTIVPVFPVAELKKKIIRYCGNKLPFLLNAIKPSLVGSSGWLSGSSNQALLLCRRNLILYLIFNLHPIVRHVVLKHLLTLKRGGASYSDLFV